MKQKVHIVGGYSEGSWQVECLTKAFAGTKLELSDSSERADIIVAHSAGCYSLPTENKARLIVLIGPPYWPGKSIVLRVFQSSVRDITRQIYEWGFGFWARLRLANAVHAITHPLQHMKIWRTIRRTLIISTADAKVVMIRNLDDPFCSPDIKDYVKQFANAKYIELPGMHEDLWANPKLYVELLLKEL